MSKTTVHIINHTHWDREWFLTSVYTTAWIPGLIDRLEDLVAENPSFRYLLDGQTLIIEDLLKANPEYEAKVHALVSAGNLLIGPYYCQPDWQLTGGETLFRNLQYGLEINAAFDGQPGAGWMVDTFGHVSQSPQIHQHFGIDTVFVWRGVPELEPYFSWHGAGAAEVFAINLFGGYRNLYGVTHAPSIAEIRLEKEASRLIPYYPTPDIPLFDGYDLEDNPEDPVRWFAGRGQLPPTFDVIEATPASFGEAMRLKLDILPAITGELNSGKFGATFPGTFSSRAYLKLLGHDCESLLYDVVEPLAAMAYAHGVLWEGERYKVWTKAILENVVHDAICGVSIDQVHEKMEYSYRRIFAEMTAEIERLTPAVLPPDASGRYVISTCTQPVEQWVAVGDELLHIHTDGLGVYPAGKSQLIKPINSQTSSFNWSNGHYDAQILADGQLQIDGVRAGKIKIFSENGDTYSDEAGELIGEIVAQGLLTVVAGTENYTVVSFKGSCHQEDIVVDCEVTYSFDASPMVGIAVVIDSRGCNFHAEFVLETGLSGDIWAGMPYDRVKRPVAVTDLMPRQVNGDMRHILMGQRELNQTHTFPMHGFVGCHDGEHGVYLFSKGNRSYRSWANGELAISLRRSVEWVTESNLQNRIGDAGPFFYVPDARCERRVRHEMAIYVGAARPDEVVFDHIYNAFHRVPLLVEVDGSAENQSPGSPWILHKSTHPVGAIWPEGDQLWGRYWYTNGEKAGVIDTQLLAHMSPQASTSTVSRERVRILNMPAIRVGLNQGAPDPSILVNLRDKISDLASAAENARVRMAAAVGHEKLRIEHEVYVHEREMHEFMLSVRLNELKIEHKGQLTEAYLYEPDPAVIDIGFKLNQLRIKRRIFDYVVTAI